jgi:surfeit locus 1 family protein
VLLLFVAVALATTFGRLGAWQLERRAERRAHNVRLAARLADSSVDVSELSGDTASGRYRRVHASGTFLYDRELTLAARAREGSPGVHLLTPLRAADADTLIIVDRGWVYSPDAKSVDRSRWREADRASVDGWAETWWQTCPGLGSGSAVPAVCGDAATRTLRRLHRAVAEALVRAPVSPYLVVQTSDSAPRPDSVPARVSEPMLDDGPHLGYAMQWFTFAALALAGGIVLAARSRAAGNSGTRT